MKIKALFFCITILMLSGCAIYAPVSEGIIYHDQEETPYLIRYTRPFPHAEAGIALSYMLIPELIRNGVREDYRDEPIEGGGVRFENQFLISPPNVTFSVPVANRAAVGINLFTILPGVDGTVHLFGDTWLTVTAQAPLLSYVDTEVVLQKPLYKVQNGGISAGLFYRNERLIYYRRDQDIRLTDFSPNTFKLEWFGGRVFAQIPDLTDSTRLKVIMHGGYNRDYGSALFTIGIGISRRPTPQTRPREPFIIN